MKFFQLMDADKGGSLSVAEFTKAFRVIGHKLGGPFTHPGAYKLYTTIDADRSTAVTKQEFCNGVLQYAENDANLMRILLAVDRITYGGLGGLFKTWRGLDYKQWNEEILNNEAVVTGSGGSGSRKLTSLVRSRNSTIGVGDTPKNHVRMSSRNDNDDEF